jgi:hypothetical protein
MRTIEGVLDHIRAEYLEMQSHFLCLKPDGAYTRATDGADLPRPHPVKAHLKPASIPQVLRDSAGSNRHSAIENQTTTRDSACPISVQTASTTLSDPEVDLL